MKQVTGKIGVDAIYEAERKGDVKHSQADNTRAREWFGYEKLIGLEEGIRETIEWWRTSRFAR
jgi:nucleoside-diphosphate-sugar epimerase